MDIVKVKLVQFNTPNSQKHVNILREDSVISLLISYIELNFDVIHAASNNRYADNVDIRLVNLGPVAFFNKYELTTSSGKQLERHEHGHIACLMYTIITTARGYDDLSIGFHRNRDTRQPELTNNKI